ncbi:DUF5808 domain-containing protein [Gracilimonas mengyeensis]|uniref:DUF5808 domain-containing protein n=1 Tax=Gracilimonas mengyeensis TaxID=1302730 RepID=A0A521C7P8_9BACT|nr:DUF5808 domain-containing protein [Gracilimonas mengyeensis]SMO54831.1 hypothetical protein SAMN06265219_104194 [Gracilimonas mengyeensis]
MTLFIIVGILAIVVGFMLYGSMASQKWHKENRGQQTITQTEHFHGHLFYFNSDDNRIFVPKQTGGGFTINFANPISVAALILLLSGTVAIMVLEL